MECPTYYVMRYEARVSPEGEDEVWSAESQVGSKRQIRAQEKAYADMPEHYRNIRCFVCNEEPVIFVEQSCHQQGTSDA